MLPPYGRHARAACVGSPSWAVAYSDGNPAASSTTATILNDKFAMTSSRTTQRSRWPMNIFYHALVYAVCELDHTCPSQPLAPKARRTRLTPLPTPAFRVRRGETVVMRSNAQLCTGDKAGCAARLVGLCRPHKARAAVRVHCSSTVRTSRTIRGVCKARYKSSRVPA